MAEPAGGGWLRRGPGITSAEVHGEVVLLDLQHGRYYSLNRTGAVVWELLSEPRTLAELQAALVERFEVEPAAALGDLRELLDDLRRSGLIEEGVPDSAPAP